jgi:uncharacterized protein YprB with RNaseH-like and TPR domain
MAERHIDIKRELEELKKKAEGVFSRRRGTAGEVGAGPFGGAGEPRSPIALPEAVPGEVTPFGGGAFYRVLAGAESVWPDAGAFHREYLETLGNPFFPEGAGFAALKALKAARPERICYLDIETTGLRMSPLFLVGLMYTSAREPGGRLVLDQLFARDYSEEETVLGFLADELPRFDVLVTFNGISFDMPYIQERVTVHRLALAAPPTHIDLLLVARAVVGGRTPNHRLQTLEAHFCGRKRVGDIPGAEIPQAYHDFVRTHDAKDMANVIHHNRLDLVTMLQLVTVFLSRES